MKKTSASIFILIAALLFLLAACATPTAVAPETESPAGVSAQAAISEPPDPAPTPTPAPTPAPTATDTMGAYQENAETVIADGFYIVALTEEIKKRITGLSYPADAGDIGIAYDDLRYIRLKYYDFEGGLHEDGELIVNARLAEEVAEIFYKLYQAKYPFTSIRLVDDYGEAADDDLSMAANNTSAFNYRRVTGSDTLSLHSYGVAIDINPRLNPYIDGERVAPENGAEYADRSLGLPGMIDHDDLCYQLFTEQGWKWGGNWEGDKDYQHFSKKLDS